MKKELTREEQIAKLVNERVRIIKLQRMNDVRRSLKNIQNVIEEKKQGKKFN